MEEMIGKRVMVWVSIFLFFILISFLVVRIFPILPLSEANAFWIAIVVLFYIFFFFYAVYRAI